MSTSTDSTSADSPAATFYQLIGGEETVRRLVDAFYAGVADDPVLRPMYPADDLGPANDRLRWFFIQLFGGPAIYSEQRGNTCLPSAHAPFTIDAVARDAWLTHMRAALDDLALEEKYDHAMWNYMQGISDSLRNVHD